MGTAVDILEPTGSSLGYPIQATVGGIQTQAFAAISLQDAPVNSGDSKLRSLTFSSEQSTGFLEAEKPNRESIPIL